MAQVKLIESEGHFEEAEFVFALSRQRVGTEDFVTFIEIFNDQVFQGHQKWW